MKIEIDFNAKTITPLTKVTAKDLADLVDKLPGDSSELTAAACLFIAMAFFPDEE
jgi:hypothetical protein